MDTYLDELVLHEDSLSGFASKLSEQDFDLLLKEAFEEDDLLFETHPSSPPPINLLERELQQNTSLSSLNVSPVKNQTLIIERPILSASQLLTTSDGIKTSILSKTFIDSIIQATKNNPEQLENEIQLQVQSLASVESGNSNCSHLEKLLLIQNALLKKSVKAHKKHIEVLKNEELDLATAELSVFLQKFQQLSDQLQETEEEKNVLEKQLEARNKDHKQLITQYQSKFQVLKDAKKFVKECKRQCSVLQSTISQQWQQFSYEWMEQSGQLIQKMNQISCNNEQVINQLESTIEHLVTVNGELNRKTEVLGKELNHWKEMASQQEILNKEKETLIFQSKSKIIELETQISDLTLRLENRNQLTRTEEHKWEETQFANLDLQQERDILCKQLDKATELVKEKENQIAVLQYELNLIQDSNSEIMNRLSLDLSQMEERFQTVKQLKSKQSTSQLTKQLEKENEDLKLRLFDLEKQVQLARSAIANSPQSNNLNNDFENSILNPYENEKQKIAELEIMLEDCTNELEESNSLIQQLTKQNSQLKETILMLEKQLSQNQIKESLQTDIENMNSLTLVNESLTKQLDWISQERDALLKKYNKLKHMIQKKLHPSFQNNISDSISSSSSSSFDESKTLEELRKHFEAERELLKQQISSLSQSIATLNCVIEERNTDKKHLLMENEELKQKMKQAMDKIAKLKRETIKLRNREDAHIKENSEYRRMFAELFDEKQELDIKLNAMQHEFELLQNKHATLQHQLKMIEQEKLVTSNENAKLYKIVEKLKKM